MNLLGVDLLPKRLIVFELTKIYGIGKKTSLDVCNSVGIVNKRVFEVSSSDFNKLRLLLEKMNLGFKLKKTISLNIQNLIKIGCYKGMRHKNHLPVRGQKTRKNSRTARKINK
ncbi:30S ribosomal protein S13 [Candidatus Vidania fulgoroideorum]